MHSIVQAPFSMSSFKAVVMGQPVSSMDRRSQSGSLAEPYIREEQYVVNVRNSLGSYLFHCPPAFDPMFAAIYS